jgi:hypothetical protein
MMFAFLCLRARDARVDFLCETIHDVVGLFITGLRKPNSGTICFKDICLRSWDFPTAAYLVSDKEELRLVRFDAVRDCGRKTGTGCDY